MCNLCKVLNFDAACGFMLVNGLFEKEISEINCSAKMMVITAGSNFIIGEPLTVVTEPNSNHRTVMQTVP